MEGEAADLRSYTAFNSNFFLPVQYLTLGDILTVNNRKSDVNHPSNELTFTGVIPVLGFWLPTRNNCSRWCLYTHVSLVRDQNYEKNNLSSKFSGAGQFTKYVLEQIHPWFASITGAK